MKFGVVLPLSRGGVSVDPAAVLDLAQAAENLGYDSLWLQDGALDGGLEALTMLAAIATRTRRPRLGFSILVLPQRETFVTARALATIDRLSGGRLQVGVGVGSAREPSVVYDAAPQDRGRLMDEQLETMRRLWSGEPLLENTRWVRVERAYSSKPAGPMPIWIGTWGNEGGLKRTVRVGSGWFASGIRTKQDRFAASTRRLDELCAEAGRDPRSIERGYANCPLALAGDRDSAVAMAAPTLKGYGLQPLEAGVPFIGTPDDARHTLERVRALNPDLVCVFPQSLDSEMLAQFKNQVVGDFS